MNPSALANGLATTTTAPTSSDSAEWNVVKSVAELIHRELSPAHQRQGPLVNFMEPQELRKAHPIAIQDEGDGSVASILSLCQSVIDSSVRTSHPFYQNQLFQGVDPYGLAASFLIEALNTNVHTYEISPAFQVIETEVVNRLGRYCGFEETHGTFTPGGSMANMYAISLARHRLDPSIKERGLYTHQPLAIFSSDQCHYSIQKGASFMGLGKASIFDVATDANGAMIPQELEKRLREAEAQGYKPLMVNATEGTTVLGAFDPLESIADICQQWGIWLHADACLGGALLLSPTHRHHLAGIHRCDSVTWNWHKLAGAPLLCSAFLTPHKGSLAATHGFGAEYLFKRKYYNPENDRGDWSIQCGRKADAVKVWMMLKARGAKGLEKLVDSAVSSAERFAEKVRGDPDFQLVLEKSQCTSVCFWVLTPEVKELKEGSNERSEELEKVALRLKESLVKAGEAMVAYQPIASKGLPSFFRVTIGAHPGMSEEDMDRLLRLMREHANSKAVRN